MTSSRSRLCASASAMRNSAGWSMRGSSRRTHSVDGCAAGIRHRVGRALGTVAVAIDADLGERVRPARAAPTVWYIVPFVIGDEPIVAAVPHQPDHLVRVHVALAEQREHHHPERREAVDGILHRLLRVD